MREQIKFMSGNDCNMYISCRRQFKKISGQHSYVIVKICCYLRLRAADLQRSHCEVVSLTRAMFRLTLWSAWSQIACFHGKQVYG